MKLGSPHSQRAKMTPTQRKYLRQIGKFLAATITGDGVDKQAKAAEKLAKAVEKEATK